ncbi:MAG: ABC transporter permease [Bacillota bacterium]
MHVYIIKRLFLSIPVLLLVSVVVFSITRLVPGDVVIMMLEETGRVTAEGIATLRAELGLDKPILVQFFIWLYNVLQGDLGTSFWSRQPVMNEIIKRLPVTLELALGSMIVSVLIAVPAGIIAAIRRNTIWDYIVRFMGVIGLSVPFFFLGTLLLILPSRWFGWVPPLGFTPITQDLSKNLLQMILPVMIIGVTLAAYLMRMTRSSILDVLYLDYIRTAYAKGVKEKMILYRHALKNALIPILSVIGVQLGPILGGTVIAESIFSLPGLGRLTIVAIQTRDFPQLQANVLIFATMFILLNLFIDIVYAWVDPRIRY